MQKLEDFAPALSCPRDGSALRSTRGGGVLVEECPSCAGVWMEAHVVNCVARDDELTALSRVLVSAQESPTTCPRCRVACKPASLDEVDAAYCPSCHGLWVGQAPEGPRRRGILASLP